jgi:hypothetical protein
VGAFKLIALVVLVALAGTLVQPAPAEAVEPMTILTIVGVAVGVVLIIAVVVIANIREKQGGLAAGEPAVVAFDTGAVQGL